MGDREQLTSLLKEAEVYRVQGLLEESLEITRRALRLVEGHEVFSRNRELVDSLHERIRTLEQDLAEMEQEPENPDLPQEMQDLIRRLFSFSQNQDIAAIEGAVALAEFGQYEKSLAAFERLIREGPRSNMEREMQEVSAHFNSIVKQLRDSYKHIREQSSQLCRYARELSQSYKRIREEQDLRARLSRYVGQGLVDRLVQSDEGVLFENEKREVTVLFADIRSFTSISERMAAEDVVAMLNQFFSAMVDILFRHNGVLDKFVGDQIMAVFGLVAAKDGNPCADAVAAALEMQDATARLMKLRARKGQDVFEIGIGINTGVAILGNVGSRNRMDYTVIGDCVNVAGRFQQIAKGGEIVIGEETCRRGRGDFSVKKKGKIRLKNKAEPVLCYRVSRT
ncbi:MAG: hypothetical protein JW821_09480 [Deltaproteobacteria bacterium]|nr:hypothetical protein [Deltaproteobacteria bacterium]